LIFLAMALGDFADYLRFAEKGVQGFGSGKCWACIRAATESLGIDGSLRMPFVGNALLSTKHVLYTAIIFGWPKEYSSMRVPKAKSEDLSNRIWSHALKQAPACNN
jgi:hypothetical protein